MSSTFELVREEKIRDLLPDIDDDEDFEASGVLARNGRYFVVCDNRTSVARLSADFDVTNMNGLFGMSQAKDGYEGISYNPRNNRYYLILEAVEKDGEHHSEVYEYDSTLTYKKHRPLEFAFEKANKGFEAVAHVRRNRKDYVLGLCEGNKCKGGNKGRKPGNGRVQLFEKAKKKWNHRRTIKLPKAVMFRDYSGMAIGEDRVAVVSQEDSLLWIGVFDEKKWEWTGDGKIYEFPRTPSGDIHYGNIEGVDWISERRIVTVSDRRKDGNNGQPGHYADKDQSIHIFDLPD